MRSICTRCLKRVATIREARTQVFDIIERLVKEGMLEELGNDFYSLTEKGSKTVMSDE